ncbi:MAG: leucyl/phenylalanyl-tRNA--protein transferase [Bacteriovoracaceae bacterium]|nr:leucyl/phenylalanyl-tRNA--protein transferase [Bacteroidota bacterium]
MKIYSTLSDGCKIIDSQFLLNAYCNGMFPMADGPNGEIHWFSPEHRGIIPLNGLNISRSLRQTLRKKMFNVKIDTAFEETIRACAEREDVWISETIVQSYCELFRLGFAHSVECWYQHNLVGGLYGVSIGGAFFGESMFSRVTDASKTALVYLVERMNRRGYTLLDTQYQNDHLATLGCIEISKQEYIEQLERAISLTCNF